jgi:hypothetical protein
MKPTLVKDRTHCPKGHDLNIHGYYFGTNQRCRACNRRRVRDQESGIGRKAYPLTSCDTGSPD